MDPNQAAADWQKANQLRMVERAQTFVKGAPMQTVAPSVAVHSVINPKKLQAQGPFFRCPEWATMPSKGIHLEVRRGADMVDLLNIDEQPYYLFGRNQGVVDFVLEHPSISRVHFALVHHQHGGTYIIDLGSGHGTAINNRKLERNKPVKFEVNSALQAGASSRTYVLRGDVGRPSEPQQPATAFDDRKRPREEERTNRVKEDGILAGWDLPVKKQAKRKQPDIIQCCHILLAHRDLKKPFDRFGRPVLRTKDEAFRALAALKEEIILNLDGIGPEAKMRKLAKKESDCQTWKKGGDLGKMRKGQWAKEFEQVAFNLEVGEIGGPVESEHGVHLLMRTELTAD
eukprot:GGOE01043837.1.p1 GENE.GGOE01043837.1~~GGOE01043837.1.p1  ORF type:complete len:343 (+),score=64.17 GGOE01043837.1:35-1063(+)